MPDINIPFDAVNLDLDAQDKFIRSIGVEFLHYEAVICPVGVGDMMDTRPSHHDHNECSNGYIYRFAGVVSASFTSNSATSSLSDVGMIDGSVVNVTFPRFYNDSPEKRVYVQIYDRFYIKNQVVLVPNSQLVEAHLTGTDKFTYKIEEVVGAIVDSNNKHYGPSDYTISDGKLIWNTGNRPGFNPEINKGTTYSIRYLYTPFFYCSRLIHEVRIANKSNFITGAKTNARAPYSAFLSREYYLYKEEKSLSEDTRRDLIQPRDSSFGPR